MRPYKLPLKFIGLWILNITVLLALGLSLGIHDFLIHTLRLSVASDIPLLYLVSSALLAAAEEWLLDKLKGNT